MNRAGKTLTAAIAIATLAALPGCYGTGKPGGYKGSTDPLLAKHARPEQKEALKERFKMVDSER